MNSQLWKTVLDDLDEDIVNSAAERFGRVKFSGENPEEYPADNSPTEYKSPADKGRSRRRFIIGMSSTAAAVVAGVFILRGVLMPQEVTPPLAGGTSEASSVPAVPVDYIESEYNMAQDNPVEIKTGVFNSLLFEEYFYGLWGWPTADYNLPMELSYQQSTFGFGAGRTLVEMEKTSDGCYMLAQTDSCYEVWFVSENDRKSMFVYRGVQVVNGTVMRKDNGEFICDSFIEHSYDGAPEESESDRLGYFAIEKLAEEMGVSVEWLLTQDIRFEGGEAELWTRSGAIFPDWDNVFLLDRSDNSVTLSMPYVSGENYDKQQYFDVTFERDNSGSWAMTGVQSGKLYFGSEELHSGLTKEGLQLFKQHFSDWWYNESDEYPSIVLIYKDDIFTPAEPCSGIAEVTGGWAMRQQSDEGRIYYIPEDDTQNMYLYIPDENGFAKRDEYAAVYERSGGAMGYAGSCRISWLGLERYKFMHDDNPDGDSLASAIERALTQDIQIGGSAAYYTADMEGWDGYRIAEQSETLVLFSYQLFNSIGESCWVTQELVKNGANWTLGEITERELTNDDIVRDEGFVPITWSDDFPLESEVEADG